jgi:hypothetical protein
MLMPDATTPRRRNLLCPHGAKIAIGEIKDAVPSPEFRRQEL